MATDSSAAPDGQAQASESATAAPPPSTSRTPTPRPPFVKASSSSPNPGTYWGYLFKRDKTPTELLDALLRAIAKHISAEIGDKQQPELVKSKLAAFYKEVGGNYDSLFVAAPDKSISYIWQALGVQHSLQPTGNDFEEPSVPALTLKGFARWESLQILLGPEEHVPFMQFAVRNWALKHPDTGAPFPVVLPKEAFPAECDPAIDEWHRGCAEKLRREATQKPSAHDPRIHFNHVPGPQTGPSRHVPGMDYFERERPKPAFAHIPRNHPIHHSQSPHREEMDPSSSNSSSPPHVHTRQRSFTSYHPYSPMQGRRTSGGVDPQDLPPHGRHHSHPRRYSSTSSSPDSDTPPSPRARLRPHDRSHDRPAASVRVFQPDGSPAPPSVRARRAELDPEFRPDGGRRRSLPSNNFGTGFRHKLKEFFPGSSDRPRSTSRSDRGGGHGVSNGARLRPEPPTSRFGRRWSEDTLSTEDSDSDVSPKHLSSREMERQRARARAREREMEEEMARSRRDKVYPRRPGIDRRTSSAADVDRIARRSRDRGWHSSDYRDRDRDRERDPRRVLTGDERERKRRSDRDRDRERGRDRDGSPVVTGVGGRKYPADGY